jgi:hypothetical protein
MIDLLRTAWDARHPTGPTRPLSRPSDTLSPAWSGGEGARGLVVNVRDFSVVLIAAVIAAATPQCASAADVTLAALTLQTEPGMCAAPVSAEIDLPKLTRRNFNPAQLRLFEVNGGGKAETPVQAQFERANDSHGRLWWMLSPSSAKERRFVLRIAKDTSPITFTITPDSQSGFFDIAESAQPVLRYNHGEVAAPAGIAPRYARANYIMPLFGLNGEILTDDFPKDHPHHRGVSWAWPVTRLHDEVRDLFAVVGVWARPVKMHRIESGPVFALLEAENVWRWNDEREIVREEVVIRAFPKDSNGRFVDVEVRLTALVDGVAIGGRPERGYGGFGLRAANSTERTITCFTDPPGAIPRRAWLDYSGVFPAGSGVSGVTIIEHVTNPNYPGELHQYGHCNYVMPAFPGKPEVSLSRTEPLVLKHRLWVHNGKPDEKTFNAVWSAYADSPKLRLSKK